MAAMRPRNPLGCLMKDYRSAFLIDRVFFGVSKLIEFTFAEQTVC
jgi:hypothetical protein